MAFKAYRGNPFKHTHENLAFNELYDILETNWSDSTDPIYLLGNFCANNVEFDALIIKRNAIIIIDFKDYGGKLEFFENGDWKIDGIIVKGGNSKNPYQQLRNNRIRLIEYFKNGHVTLKSDPNIGHISALVIFQKEIEFDSKILPIAISRWFHINDMKNVFRIIDAIASDKIDFGDDDLASIIKAFNIKEYFPDGKPQTDKILKNDDHSAELKFADSKIKLRSRKYSGSSLSLKGNLLSEEDSINLSENIHKLREKNQK